MVGSVRLSETLAEDTPHDIIAAPIPQLVTPDMRRARRTSSHHLSRSQTLAIRAAMQLFVDDDLAKGISLDQRLYCAACERPRPAAGFIQYSRYHVCNSCAIEYEIAHARGLTASPGQYVRDKNFGETGRYGLDGL